MELPLAGTVLAHGGGALGRTAVAKFVDLCGGRAGKLVLLPTASAAADKAEYRDKIAGPWLRRGLKSVVVLHTNDPAEADQLEFVAPLSEATCAWLGGGAQARLESAYVGTRLEDALHELVLRGGAIGGYSAGAAILSRVMIRRGNPEPEEGTGLGLLPGVIVDQHFVAANREPRLLAMLARHSDLVGFGIDEGTCLVVTGDRFSVLGDSVVRRCTHDGCVTLKAGETGTFPGR